ncbi:TPA: glycosyltransferase [Candidatus Poribacteria bacterium]|nr:glycosyltransferase [Candidatus Poribacteria bacterium]
MRDTRSGDVRDVIDIEVGSHISPVVPSLRKDELMGHKILHITLSIDRGGLETLVLRLCAGIGDGFEPLICTFSPGGDLQSGFKRLCVPVYHLVKPEGLTPFLPLRVASLIGELKVDLIHTHNVGPLIYGGLASIITGLPLVHTEHSRLPQHEKRLRSIEKALSLKASKIVAVSKCVADQLINEQGIRPDKVMIIPNGVDVDLFAKARQGRDDVRKELGIGDGEIVIGTVGRLAAVKDYATLIQAFALVKAGEEKTVKLLMVGDGPEREKLERTADEIGVREHVIFLGMRDDVPELMAAMDIFALSSIDEGLPLAILEAMSAGLPIVATEVGGIPEAVEHGLNGFLLPPRSPQRMAIALQKLIDEPELRRRFSIWARRRVVERFSIRAMIKAYRSIYKEILSG